MGQRHQIYVIARVQGHYRCIAAFHSQWLYGGMVVKAAARLIRAFVNPINAVAIASELAALERLDISAISQSDNNDWENPDVLCPYLTGLVLRPELCIHFLPSQLDNDEGYTCFDLTNAGWPQYCFWWNRTRPLTAYEYLGRGERAKRAELDASVYGILSRCALLSVDALADVWPYDFDRLLNRAQLGRSKDKRPAADRPNSLGFVYSAESALEAIKRASVDRASEAAKSERRGVTAVLLFWRKISGLLLGDDPGAVPHATPLPSDPTHTDTNVFDPNHPDLQPYVSSFHELAKVIQSSNLDLLDEARIASVVESLVQPPPSRLRSLRAELLAASTLDRNDILRLKQLLTAEGEYFVDLKPWLATGALDAATLLEFSDALQHAECLDLSFSSTLTAEILEALVLRLPNIRHVIAFGCNRLASLSRALPLMSYFASLPMLDAIDQTRFIANPRFAASYPILSTPECMRWVEESDPPAGLTIVLYSPPLLMQLNSLTPIRYGIELSHFGAEGVVRGFARYLELLYHPDYWPTQSGCYFEMRAYFHSTASSPLRQCIPTCNNDSASYALGCLPSLIRAPSPEDEYAYPVMRTSTASGAVTSVPRHTGWVLLLDTKGTMPYHQEWSTGFPRRREVEASVAGTSAATDDTSPYSSNTASPLVSNDHSDSNGASKPQTSRSAAGQRASEDEAATPTLQRGGSLSDPGEASPQPPDEASASALGATSSDSSSPPDPILRPEYAFERWDLVPGQKTKELRVVERVSVREWVGRLPAGHGPVPESLLAECEAVLARLNVALRGSTDEAVATI